MNIKKEDSQGVIDAIIGPFQRFLKIESAGGILLLLSTLVALFWANSSWGNAYHEFWENHLTLEIGGFILSKSYLHWINDGLMAIFFFFVGLEIKREISAGELSSIKQSSLPIAAAIGGMVFPALIFILINKNPDAESGWGIPMATDIAFSLGVLSLLGKRVPISLKVFLVAFAIVDDIGAVLVIALFYSGDILWNYLMIGAGLYLILIIFNRSGIYYIPAYMIIGWVIWYMFYKSGIHPTIAGVLIAFVIPMNRRTDVGTFRQQMEKNLAYFSPDDKSDKITLTKDQLASIDNIYSGLGRVQSPVQSLEDTLHHFVTFIIMPLFALANAGVVLQTTESGSFFSGVGGSIAISLILGKVLGIFLFTWLSIKFAIGILPDRIKWIHIAGVGLLGGMGFTMSLFIGNLAFTNADLLNFAKVGILIGSLLAGVMGYLVLSMTLGKSERRM